MEKIALFAFNGEPMCFVHVLLNSLDLREKGFNTALIIEGSATKLIQTLNNPESQNHDLYVRVKESGIIDSVCQACSHKMGVLEEVKAQGLPISSELKGHPSMARYLEEGYRIITF